MAVNRIFPLIMDILFVCCLGGVYGCANQDENQSMLKIGKFTEIS